MSGPGARPLLRHPSACATSAAVTGWWVNVDCQCMGPVVHQIDLKTALQPFINGISFALTRSYTFAILGVNSQWWECLVDFIPWTALNILWLSSVKAISLANWSTLWQATSSRQWLICLNMRARWLHSSLWSLASLHLSMRSHNCRCCCDKLATRWSWQ